MSYLMLLRGAAAVGDSSLEGTQFGVLCCE